MPPLHDHNFKDLPTDWRHDGPLSARNDEKHLLPANAQPTPGALSAAANFVPEEVGKKEGRTIWIKNTAEIIDRLAVKPATAELLAVLQTVVQNLKFMRAQFGHLLITMDSQAIDIGIDRAESILAKYEART